MARERKREFPSDSRVCCPIVDRQRRIAPKGKGLPKGWIGVVSLLAYKSNARAIIGTWRNHVGGKEVVQCSRKEVQTPTTLEP